VTVGHFEEIPVRATPCFQISIERLGAQGRDERLYRLPAVTETRYICSLTKLNHFTSLKKGCAVRT
jgi:hypothetical protein